MTYAEALQYLDSFLNYEQTVQYHYPEAFSLDRVRALLSRLGDPQNRYPTLHVAGTKGKGSTCVFAASILQAAGLRTGLYTSPHLFSIRERFQINGVPISEPEMTGVVDALRRVSPEKELTYFEVTTACAFLHFARSGVDAAVIEVGLGGRLDATNVLNPAVTAITPVSLDHMDKLGNTLAQIAGEKAGIVKSGIPVVVSPQPPEAVETIERTAQKQGAPLHRLEREVSVREPKISLQGSTASFQTPVRLYRQVQVPLLGRHQLINAAAAIRLTELFAERGAVPALSEESVTQGIARVRWPGRCQLVEGTPPVILDGAQNAESARVLKETVRELFPGRPVILIVGTSADKDLEGMAGVWGAWAKRVILTRAAHPRAASLDSLEKAFAAAAVSVERSESVDEALQKAKEKTAPGDLIAVSGSLFVAGEALKRLSSVDGGPGREQPRSRPPTEEAKRR